MGTAKGRVLFLSPMKINSRFLLGCAAALLAAHVSPAATSPEFEQRTVRLYEIAVHRYLPGPAVGQITEKRYLLDAQGKLTRIEVTTVPTGVTMPEAAFDKVLINGAAWQAYRQLGPQAFANFELVTEIPFEIAGRFQFEVRAVAEPKLDIGEVVNLSTRGLASREEKLNAGFVITGHSRRVLVRAVGPGLSQFGVSQPLADPYLTVFRGATPHYYNDDWNDRPDAAETAAVATQVGAFPLTNGSKDAALVVELEPGVYSVHVEPANSVAGVALVEVYEVP